MPLRMTVLATALASLLPLAAYGGVLPTTIVVPNADTSTEANGADNFTAGSGCGQQ